MRRPASLACLAAAALTGAAPAGAQRVFRQAFAPAVTPYVGITAFGDRTVGPSPTVTANDFNNSIAFGAQLDHPLSRRTGLLASLALSPFTRVNASRNDSIVEGPRTVAVAVDVGIAGRFKPSAPAFGFVGLGSALFSRPARVPDPENPSEGSTIVEPRASAGVGIDLMRRQRDGVRVMWIAHYAVPREAGDDRYTTNSSAFDWTLVVGARLSLGRQAPEAER